MDKQNGLSKLLKILDSGSDINNVLMEFRTTPISGMVYSSSQLLMSRGLRTKLPCVDETFRPNAILLHVKSILYQRQTKAKVYENKRALPPIKNGELVRMQHHKGDSKKWAPAMVIEKHSSPRLYTVESADGITLYCIVFPAKRFISIFTK